MSKRQRLICNTRTVQGSSKESRIEVPPCFLFMTVRSLLMPDAIGSCFIRVAHSAKPARFVSYIGCSFKARVTGMIVLVKVRAIR